MPLHVLHDEAIVNALRGRANTAAAGGDGTAGPVDRLFTFITDSIEYVQTCVKEKTERHRKHKQRLVRSIKECDKFLGTYSASADVDSIADEGERERRRGETEMQRQSTQEELLRLLQSERKSVGRETGELPRRVRSPRLYISVPPLCRLSALSLCSPQEVCGILPYGYAHTDIMNRVKSQHPQEL